MTDKFAFIFPGQGSQTVGMLAELASTYPAILTTFDEASAVLQYDAWELCQTNPNNALDNTEFTQPLLLCASVAIWRLWRALSNRLPAFLAGHSLGEFSALVAAEAIEFADALKAVALRGKFMQQAVPAGTGAMAAVLGLSNPEVQQVCDDIVKQSTTQEWVAPANYNAPLQVVISGHKTAVIKAMELAKTRGAKLVKLLAVSVPSHCRLMNSAAEQLQQFLASIHLSSPTIPIVNNVAAVCESEPVKIRQALVLQLCQSVRWTEVIQQIVAHDSKIFMECGANTILAGINKRIDKSITTFSLETPLALQQALQVVADSRHN
jgi:[acyl-carrier-protein] S-malonyltransferase